MQDLLMGITGIVNIDVGIGIKENIRNQGIIIRELETMGNPGIIKKE